MRELAPEQLELDNEGLHDAAYRPDIDGLRAIAVVIVVLFHAFPQWLKGGFIGVDIFFVISGYLITRVILNNVSKDCFSLQQFYASRIRRIVPALILVLLFCYLVGWNTLFKDEFKLINKHIAAGLGFIYNLLAWSEAGYFDISADHKPLLHLWSLGIEEQFYIFWPFIIVFLKPNRVFSTICLIIIASIVSKVIFYLYIGKWMATSFFTLNCMYALGIGGLLAYITLYKRRFAEIISKPIWLYSVLLFNLVLFVFQYKFHLGWYKEIGSEILFACLAALIILRASNNGFRFGLKYILEHRFVVYSGTISYGLYVYHLFVPSLFYIYAPCIGLGITNKYTLFIAFYLLTFLIAHYSWVFIEKPINAYKSRFPYIKDK